MSSIAFLIDSAVLSGGSNIIFQHCMELSRRGHDVSIISERELTIADFDWHPIKSFLEKGEIRVCRLLKAKRSFDICIATWWRTAFSLWKIEAARYVYFVQSIESRFYELENYRQLVEGTYELPVSIITISPWMADYLQAVHGVTAKVARNGVDKHLFNRSVQPLDQSRPNGVRFLVEGPIDVPFKNVPEAIELCREAGAGDVWLLSSSDLTEHENVDRVFSRVPLADVAQVYASCDVLVKLSYVEGMFGPPLEMFHCGGTAVVYGVTGHDDYIVHGSNGLVAEPGDRRSVVQYLQDVIGSPDLLSHLKEGASLTASKWCDPVEASSTFCDHLFACPVAPSGTRQRLKTMGQRMWAILATTPAIADDGARDKLILQEYRIRREMLGADHARERDAIVFAGTFDEDWYLDRNPDVRQARADPLDHYVVWGAQEGRDPSEAFSTIEYLRQNAEALRLGINPLAYAAGLTKFEPFKELNDGGGSTEEVEGLTLRSYRERRDELRVDSQSEASLIRSSGFFDEHWYLGTYPDVQQSGADPVEHYVLWGAQEGRDPSPGFSTITYLMRNPDVLEAGRNPFADAVAKLLVRRSVEQPSKKKMFQRLFRR